MSDSTRTVAGATHDGPTLPTADGPTHPVPPPVGFELLDEIGSGGMGVVYRARDRELNREVAVKILLPKYSPHSVTAERFVDEAQITGQLQHPGVPPVYRVGTLPDGRPFLAMKLIKGRTLDALLKEVGPGSLKWLGVFEGICQAVGYAHAHRVIHRDLKPHNVMVGAFGEVQVMDWGLAKTLARGDTGTAAQQTDPDATAVPDPTAIKSLRDADLLTQYGSILGTPAFMAPEQAIGATDQIDRRTDVFGLGAILCSLLSGKPPFVGDTAESTRQQAARAKLDDAFNRLAACGAEPDLVALCRRCLSPERPDRPADAGEVARAVAELRAAADERARRAEIDREKAEVRAAEQRKLRRVVQWAGGMVALILTLGVIGTTGGLVWANAARRDADNARTAEADQRKEAETKEAEATAVVTFFEDTVFAAARPKWREGGLGMDVTVRDAITASLPELDTRFRDQPLVEARLRNTLGNTYWYLGDTKAAVDQYERSLALSASHQNADHPDRLAITANLALGYSVLGRDVEALRIQEEVLDLQSRTLPNDHPDRLKLMGELAQSYSAVGRHGDAVRLIELTVALHMRTPLLERTRIPAYVLSVVNSFRVVGRGDEAAKLLEGITAGYERTLPPNDPVTLECKCLLAVCYGILGRRAAALQLQEETLTAQKRVIAPDHPDILESMSYLANHHISLGKYHEALKLHEAVLSTRVRVMPRDNPYVVDSMIDLGRCYSYLNRHRESLELYEASLAARARTYAPDHPRTLTVMYALAGNYYQLGRTDEAIAMYERTLAAQKRVSPPDDPSTLQTMHTLASMYPASRAAEAVKLGEEALAAHKRIYGPDDPKTLRNMNNLAIAYSAAKRHEEAVALVRDTVARTETAFGPPHPETLHHMWTCVETLVAAGRGAEAVPVIDECVRRGGSKPESAAMVSAVMDFRLRHFQKAGDAAGCRATAEMWEKLDRPDAANWYVAAGMRAVASAVSAKAGLPAEAAADAARAIGSLQKAVKAGFKDAARIKRDEDLHPLRGRDDFKKLLADLEAKFPPMKEVLPPPRADK